MNDKKQKLSMFIILIKNTVNKVIKLIYFLFDIFYIISLFSGLFNLYDTTPNIYPIN